MLNKGKVAMSGTMEELLRTGTSDMIIEYATMYKQEIPNSYRKISDKQWIVPGEHASMQRNWSVQHRHLGRFTSINPYRPTLLGMFRQQIEDAEETIS
jgi:hypothetical protein